MLIVSNVNVKTQDGDDVTDFVIILEGHLMEKPTTKLVLNLMGYRSEADYDAGFNRMRMYDSNQGLATDVPRFLGEISVDLDANSYADVDMTQVHTVLSNVLEQGDSHGQWENIVGPNRVWAGFGIGNVAVSMPD